MEGNEEIEARYKELVYGITTNYIECININYKSLRDEVFDHISLQVHDRLNLKESFEHYTMKDILEGDN